MEPEHPDGGRAPWTAGMTSVLRSEAERVRALSRSLEDHAVELRQIDPGGWSGQGHAAFSGRRTELAARCRAVAEVHARAARALDDFVAILEQLTRSARYTTDRSLLDRLSAERAEAAALAAATLTEAGEELAGLRAVLGDSPAHIPRQVSRPAGSGPGPSRTTVRPGPFPGLGLSDRFEFERRVQALSDDVRRYWA
ncbi:putative T7SS-secreted protein [Amycolatopsis azurea]|uniref:putative T7SS-secreted protein n=1 Tax=Amycolatopsis azurea TaxID=36819 RepID=UPI00380F7DB9